MRSSYAASVVNLWCWLTPYHAHTPSVLAVLETGLGKICSKEEKKIIIIFPR